MQLKSGLVAVNSFPSEGVQGADQEMKAAEEAALALWNNISKLRHDLAKSREATDSIQNTPWKRKHEDITQDTSTDDIWDAMKTMERKSSLYRSRMLEKWSSKVQASANMVTASRKLNQTATVQTVYSQLGEHVTDLSGEIAKSRVPQESAPLQKSNKTEEDPNIYDDMDFYKRLLLVLLEQRGNSATSGGLMQLAPADLQELKAKKHRANVDTKASKGRKLRYHVHDKLQNFMMPDDSLVWHENQIDEFFSSLLGQRRQVLEEAESEREDEEDEMVPVAQLFRNTLVT